MQYTQRVEESRLAVLAYCDCGWRELADDRLNARTRIHQHTLAVHPQQSRVTKDALRKARRRSA